MAYAIQCPHCKQRPVEGVRDAWYIYGVLILAWYGSKSHVGCNACTRNAVLLNLLLVSLFGWWCFPWGLGTPLVILQNLVAAASPPNEAALAGMLRAKGVNPDDLRASADGKRTFGDQRLVDNVLVTLHQMVWADGSADPREIEVGAAVAGKMLGRLVNAAEVTDVLSKPTCTIDANPKQLPDDAKPILMKAACLVAKADGVVEPAEIEALRDLGRRMGLTEDVIAKFADALQAEVPKPVDLEMKAIAAALLGVPVDAAPAEMRAAYQAQMMGAQGDAKEVAAQTEKLKFAYETLLGADAMAA